MKNVKLNLPVILDFGDYHEIDELYYSLKRVIPQIKREEIDFLAPDYYGIFYIKKDAEYKRLVKEHEKLVSNIDDE